MVTAYELGTELERAEYEALSALKEWRRIYRLVPRDVPMRGSAIQNLNRIIVALEGETVCMPFDPCGKALCPDCGDPRDTSLVKECPLCGKPLVGARLFHKDCADYEQMVADGWGE